MSRTADKCVFWIHTDVTMLPINLTGLNPQPKERKRKLSFEVSSATFKLSINPTSSLQVLVSGSFPYFIYFMIQREVKHHDSAGEVTCNGLLLDLSMTEAEPVQSEWNFSRQPHQGCH